MSINLSVHKSFVCLMNIKMPMSSQTFELDPQGAFVKNLRLIVYHSAEITVNRTCESHYCFTDSSFVQFQSVFCITAFLVNPSIVKIFSYHIITYLLLHHSCFHLLKTTSGSIMDLFNQAWLPLGVKSSWSSSLTSVKLSCR